MKLLLDANLSWRLTKLLTPDFEAVEHVELCGLPIPANDTEIWNWARDNKALIVTNDEDYYYFSLQKGFPPKVVLLRIGNQSTKNVRDVLIKYQDKIRALHDMGFWRYCKAGRCYSSKLYFPGYSAREGRLSPAAL